MQYETGLDVALHAWLQCLFGRTSNLRDTHVEELVSPQADTSLYHDQYPFQRSYYIQPGRDFPLLRAWEQSRKTDATSGNEAAAFVHLPSKSPYDTVFYPLNKDRCARINE
jgi:hypothetical protein